MKEWADYADYKLKGMAQWFYLLSYIALNRPIYSRFCTKSLIC